MGSETHVGRLLREARRGRFKGRPTGLRQIEADLGISRPTLGHWETGQTKTIPIAQAVALAEHLEVPLDLLRDAALADANDLRAAQNGAAAPSPPASETHPVGEVIREGAERRRPGQGDRRRSRTQRPQG